MVIVCFTFSVHTVSTYLDLDAFACVEDNAKRLYGKEILYSLETHYVGRMLLRRCGQC